MDRCVMPTIIVCTLNWLKLSQVLVGYLFLSIEFQVRILVEFADVA